MTGDLLIQKARIVDPSQEIDWVGDILIEVGKIKLLDKEIPFKKENIKNVINAESLILTAGWVDIHTHLRDPGFTHKETIQSGGAAAAAGGFTSIACMANTNPVNDNALITQYIVQKAKLDSIVNVFPIGSISKNLEGKELSQMALMKRAGIVAISDDGKTVMDAELMRRAMEYAKDLDLTVITHSEDSCLKGCGVMNEGLLCTQMGLKGIPKISEDIIVSRDVMLAKKLGARLHVAHVSSKGSLEIIEKAKQENVDVSAEATPHHLHLTEQAVEGYNTFAKVAPPLRTEEDKSALIEGLKNNVIEVLASDHAPHSFDEKECEFNKAEFGMVGLETAFSLYYDFVLKKHLALKDLIQAMTYSPAKIIGVNKGTLKVGADADITLFDPSKIYTIDSKRFFSKSLNTPFHGRQVQGKVIMTIVRGNIVYDFRGSL